MFKNRLSSSLIVICKAISLLNNFTKKHEAKLLLKFVKCKFVNYVKCACIFHKDINCLPPEAPKIEQAKQNTSEKTPPPPKSPLTKVKLKNEERSKVKCQTHKNYSC